MLIVGLTGGIGSGKSTVGRMFSELGVDIIDADSVARDCVTPGSIILDRIHRRFGNTILLQNGALDRAKLRKIVFDDPEEKDWLEQQIHPEVRDRIIQYFKKRTGKYAILVSPLLLETSQKQLVSRIVVVDLPEELQLQRACERDNASETDIRKIMAKQISRSERLAQADDVIDNSFSIAATREQVVALHTKYSHSNISDYDQDTNSQMPQLRN